MSWSPCLVKHCPLSLIQVGLHYALVVLPAVLTGRRDIFEMMLSVKNNNNKLKTRSRAESSFKPVIKVPIQHSKDVFL